MHGELAYSNQVTKLEKDFREVRQGVLEKQEAELMQAREELALQAAEGKRIAERNTKLFEEMGFDLKKIESAEKKEAKELDKFLERVHPKLIAQPGRGDEAHKEMIVWRDHYARLGGQQPVCLGVDLVASNEDNLKDYKHVSGVGNPSVWFNDPNDVRDIKVSHKGSWTNSACGQVVFGNVVSAIWYYSWYPTEPGSYWVVARLPYLGFYSMYSNDNWILCKYSKVDVRTSIDILQNGWLGEKKYQVFHRYHKDVSTAATLSGYADWDYFQPMLGGQYILIKLRLTLYAEAKGSGSRAELNFADGAANKVGPPAVIVGK